MDRVFPHASDSHWRFQHDLRIGLVIMLLVSSALIGVSFWNYLIFHVLAEFFSIGVAIIMFVVAWHTYDFSRNHFLMYLGCAYFWIALLDIAHTLLYFGMPTALDRGNFTSQFWIATRTFEALVLLSAPLFLTRTILRTRIFALFGAVATVLTILILQGHFPATFIEGVGLTRFKVFTEYVIIAILALAIANLYWHRDYLDERIQRLMLICLILTMGSELAFTFYVHMYGISNLIGHIFKLFSFWLIYLAIIRTTLAEPFAVMARGSSTYNAVPDPILLVDNEGIIHQANREACRQSGREEAELIGMECHPLFHPRDLVPADCPVCAALARRQVLAPLELAMGNGQEWRQFTLTPLPGGEHIGASVQVSSDISQRKRVETELKETLCTLDEKVISRTQELREKIEELELTRDELVASEKMASLGRLVAGFAHEVNTPIGIAVGSVSQVQETVKEIEAMLEREEVSEEELMDALNTVLEADRLAFNNLKRAADLVQRFKRSSVDQTSLALRDFPVREVIEDVLSSLRNQLKKSRIQIDVDCPADLSLRGAPGIIEQVLVNLLQNSLLHAFPEPKQSDSIHIYCQREGESLRLNYRDNGKGMPPETVARIFEPFFTTRRGEGGSGLGLYVCYNLINQEGGKIHCHSSPGEGTEFILTLPIH